jgi:hypothetical protein
MVVLARSMDVAEQDICLAESAAMMVIVINLVADDMSELDVLVMCSIGGIARDAACQHHDDHKRKTEQMAKSGLHVVSESQSWRNSQGETNLEA